MKFTYNKVGGTEYICYIVREEDEAAKLIRMIKRQTASFANTTDIDLKVNVEAREWRKGGLVEVYSKREVAKLGTNVKYTLMLNGFVICETVSAKSACLFVEEVIRCKA